MNIRPGKDSSKPTTSQALGSTDNHTNDEPDAIAFPSAVKQRRECCVVIQSSVSSKEWELIWSLWIRCFALGGFPSNNTAIYEGRRASHVKTPASSISCPPTSWSLSLLRAQVPSTRSWLSCVKRAELRVHSVVLCHLTRICVRIIYAGSRPDS
jgi:hypothetical protein